MKEAEIIDRDDNVQASLLSEKIISVVGNMNLEYLMVFPN